MERADEAPLEKLEALYRRCDPRNRARGLEIDVDADVLRLFREEGERVVERRKLGADLVEIFERQRSHGSTSRAVTHFVEFFGMGDDEVAAGELEHVELDEIHARLNRSPERSQRVLRRDCSRTPVTDPEGPSVASVERDHGVGCGRVGR